MFKRKMEKELLEIVNDYPVVSIIGPRQSGKTTLVRELFPQMPYVNLEAIDTQELAKKDPRAFLGKYPEGAILDEIQRVPDLLSYIQVIVDENQKKGMYILTGSHQLELHQAISQSLAGRCAILNLLPLSLTEIKDANFELSIDQAILKGGYPRIYKDNLNPTKAYRNYFQTYIERDLRQLIKIKDLSLFQKFIRLCAGRIGQILVMDSISNEVGVSSHTINEWVSILEASFVVFRVYPYFENFGKRLIKSPKIYFTDVGFASYLLGIENETQLARDPLRGNLFENLIVLELYKYRYNLGLDPRLYFYRDQSKNEIDLLFQNGSKLIPIEIKSSKTFNFEFIKNLQFFEKIAKDRYGDKSYVIYAGDLEQKMGSIELLNYKNASKSIF
jgi:uncharacterized protein